MILKIGSDLGKRVSGAMGIRTPDLLHAMQWHHVHRSPSVQVTVSGRPHESAGIQAGCCTFVLYRSEPLLARTERAQLPGDARWTWHQIAPVSHPRIAVTKSFICPHQCPPRTEAPPP